MNEQEMPIEYYVNISISDDKLFAYLHFSNVNDRFTVTLPQLQKQLEQYNIIHGIQHEVLSGIAENPKPYFLEKTTIAAGDAAVDGKDGYIHCLYDLDNEQKTPLEMDDGKVDFKEVTTIHNVKKGELIARRVLAEPGVPGTAVTGEILPPHSGKEVHFKVGKNVVVDQEKTSMYATIDGMLTQTDRDKINVFPVFEVNGDVDYNIGNIDFVGTVVIRGSVHPGFRIRAAGDIRITGGVEAAELDSDGSIEISAGILGQNKGLIKAGKNVKSSFIQEGNVVAGEDVIVTQSIMHSAIRAGRNVVCHGTKGLIVGGLIQAGERVVARTIGNSMSTNTVIEVGVQPELRNELTLLRNHLKELVANMDKTEKALALLDQLAAAGQLTPDKAAMRIKLTHTKRQANEEQNKIRERILEIEKSLETTDKARVEVHSTIYGGIKIVIGRYTRFVKDPTQRLYFCLSNGEVSAFSIA